MITIRLASVKDAELIAEMSRQTFYDAFAAQNTKEDMDKFMNEQFTKEKLAEQVNDNESIFLLAFSDSEPVGYARMAKSETPPELGNAKTIELARIYSVTNAIGKGVGKALMQKCIDTAKESGKQILWLGVWEHNNRAIDFYTRWGFEKFGSHPFVLGDDHQTDWLMKKIL